MVSIPNTDTNCEQLFLCSLQIQTLALIDNNNSTSKIVDKGNLIWNAGRFLSKTYVAKKYYRLSKCAMLPGSSLIISSMDYSTHIL